ncbi:hypothetical protein BSZ22_17695 [Bradyrhizobium canariense]|uniref:Uncharacterized protein n=1 Tax=Bradyrhizobium canariense TaxID=255045 RepID=A0A1X3FSB2_9BRAD|nr:hypothetical protein BSZ22_17695 [Bradyrhizobium canariense]OSI78309.1 hypothetical protein BSZ23_19180 [Bradyrhizobium canariense]OSI90188.1 hypothetical protein BSZ25_18320 [Bradyrhizobium canariense]OSI93536.1 hypothetical protein BSZ24_12605 [Bradyrhizobium canariense]OSJ03513.1 hypothetical protein BSZ16_15580 [Bradyrhizobium canariense]
MMLFAAGGLSYFAGRWLERGASQVAFRRAGMICLGVLAIIIVYHHLHLTTLWQIPFLLNGNILAMVAVSCPFLLALSRGSAWDSMIGELSYPMYLSHFYKRDDVPRHARCDGTE